MTTNHQRKRDPAVPNSSSPDAAKWEELYEEAQEHYHEGEFEEAEESLKEAFELARRFKDEDEDPLAMTLNLLAGTYGEMGRDEEALEAGRQALEIASRTRDENDEDLAGCYNNVAQMLVTTGNFSEAVEHFEKAIAMKRNILGEDHPQIAMSLAGLAHTYAELGMPDKAEEAYRKAVEQASRKPGLEELIRTSASYSDFLEEQERTSDIVALLKDTLAKAEAWLSQPAGDFDVLDPAETLNAALRIQFQQHGYGPESMVLLQEKLAEALFETDSEAALELERKAVAAFSEALGEDDPEAGNTFLRYAMMLHHAGHEANSQERFPAAEIHYKKALGSFAQEKEEYAPDYAAALINLAELYIDTDRTEEAKKHLDEAEEIMKDLDEEEREELEEMLDESRERLE